MLPGLVLHIAWARLYMYIGLGLFILLGVVVYM